MAAQAIVDSAIALCDTALVLRETMDPLVVDSVRRTADFDLPTGHELSRVLHVRLNRRTLEPMTFDQGQMRLGETAEGPPRSYYVARADESVSLGLFPLPEVGSVLHVTFAVKPQRKATQLHQDLFERWVDHVVEGALMRLCSIPMQPFTDMTRATAASMRVVALTNAARREATFNRVRATEMVRMRPFA